MAGDASEQSLQDLIAEAKNINASLAKLSSVLGKSAEKTKAGPSTDAAAKTINDMGAGMSKVLPLMGPAGVAIKVLTVAVEAVGKVFSMLGGLISGLFSGLANAAGILGEFAMNVTKGNMKISDLVGVFGKLAEQIPIVGGALSGLIGLFKIAMERQEDNLKIYQQISEIGAGVGMSLTNLREMSNATGLNMQEFADVVKKNGDMLSSGFGSTDAGMKVFAKGMGELRNGTSDAYRQMAGLGMKTTEMADSMMLFMKTQGSVGKQGLQDSKVLANGAADLALQMNELSTITGKQKDTIAAELKAATGEANWQAFVAGLDPEEAARATAGVADAMAKFGKDGAEQAKFAIRTGITTPITEGGRRIAVTMQGSQDEYFANMHNFVKNKNVSDAQFQKQQDDANWKMIQSTRATGMSFGDIAQLAAANGKQITNADAVTYANKFKEAKTQADYQRIMDEMRKKEKDAKNGEAADLQGRQQQLKNFGKQIDDIISGLFAPFVKPVMDLVGKFLDGGDGFIQKIKPFTDLLQKMGQQLANWLEKIINRFANIKNVEDFWKEVKHTLSEVWEEIKPALTKAFEGIMDFVITALRKNSIIARLLFGATETEKEDKKNAEIKQLTAAIEKNKKFIEENKGKKNTTLQTQANQSMEGRLKQLQGSGTAPPPPPVDQAANIRNWAYSLMTGQAKDAPDSISKQVGELVKNPDDSLKKSVADFNSAKAAKDAETKAQQEKVAEDAKKTNDNPAANPAATPAATPVPAQDTDNRRSDMLNNASVARLLKDISDNTAKTANLISANGNLFKRA